MTNDRDSHHVPDLRITDEQLSRRRCSTAPYGSALDHDYAFSASLANHDPLVGSLASALGVPPQETTWRQHHTGYDVDNTGHGPSLVQNLPSPGHGLSDYVATYPLVEPISALHQPFIGTWSLDLPLTYVPVHDTFLTVGARASIISETLELNEPHVDPRLAYPVVEHEDLLAELELQPQKLYSGLGLRNAPNTTQQTSTKLNASVLETFDGRFVCSELDCNASYQRKGDCSRHLKKHNGPFFPCTQRGCEMNFYRHDKLRAHMQQGHGITVPPPGIKRRQRRGFAAE